MEKDAYYFPHFSNSRTDRKLRRVRKDLGLEGYGIYFMLLETLREQKDFNYPFEDVDLLADEFGTSEGKVEVVICNYKLFEIDEQGNFFSPKFNEYMLPYLEGKEKKRISAIKGNHIKYGRLTKLESQNMSNSEIIAFDEDWKKSNSRNAIAMRPLSDRTGIAQVSQSDRYASQSKVKESKVKESITHFANTCFSFEEFWNTYQKKKDKHKSEQVYKKIPEADRQRIKDTIEEYVKNTELQYRKYPLTYLRGQNWNDEIIQNEFKKEEEEYKPRKWNTL